MFTHTLSFLRNPLRRLTVPLALVLACAIAGQFMSAGAATSTETTARAGQKPTVVLVHGAWEDGSSWSGVVQHLQELGYPVRVPPMTLRSLASDSSNLSHFISTIEGPIVLVGHSYGGGVITSMPADSDVKALVFVNGFAPAEGEVLVNLPGPDSALAVPDPTTVFDIVPYSGAPEGDVEIYLKPDVFRDAFANDLPADRADVLWATQRPVTGSALHEPSSAPAWQTLPSWYVLGTRDQVIPPAAQAAMAERAGSTVIRVRAGHLSPISRPNAVSEVIVQAARATVD